MHIYIYIYTSVNPCISTEWGETECSVTECSVTETCNFEGFLMSFGTVASSAEWPRRHAEAV